MPGPCPNGRPTEDTHSKARCRDKERCTGPGCRVRRDQRHQPLLTDQEQQAELDHLRTDAA